MNREDLADAGWLVANCEVLPCHFSSTSGTTGRTGTFLMQHSEEERAAFLRLRTALSLHEIGNKSLSVAILSTQHGPPFIPAPPGRFDIFVTNQRQLDHFVRILERQFCVNGFDQTVSVIFASAKMAKFLAHYSEMNSQFCRALSNVRTIVVYGDHLSPSYKRYVEDQLNCNIIDNYGVSEVPGSSAERCAACQNFHSQPIVIPEILHLDRDRRVKVGSVGELTLTPLFPYCQAHSLLRYRTGDLVRNTGICEIAKDLGYEYLGRRANSIIARNNIPVLAGQDIYNIIEDESWVNRSSNDFFPAFGMPGNLGSPRYYLRTRGNVSCIQVEAAFSVSRFHEEARKLEIRLSDLLMSKILHPAWTVEVSLVNAGVLKELTPTK